MLLLMAYTALGTRNFREDFTLDLLKEGVLHRNLIIVAVNLSISNNTTCD